MPVRVQAVITADGRVIFPWADELAALASHGTTTIRRASHVEPSPSGAGWIADMAPIGGPKFGPFALRGDALAAEQAFLESPPGAQLMSSAGIHSKGAGVACS